MDDKQRWWITATPGVVGEYFQKHRRKWISISISTGADKHAAEDIVQECIIKGLSQYQSSAINISGWFTTIVRNRTLSHLKSCNARFSKKVVPLIPEMVATKYSDTEHENHQQILIRAMEMISERSRLLIELKFYRQFTVKDIAKHIDEGWDVSKTNREVERAFRELSAEFIIIHRSYKGA